VTFAYILNIIFYEIKAGGRRIALQISSQTGGMSFYRGLHFDDYSHYLIFECVADGLQNVQTGFYIKGG
jgi:hypothetical protein